MFAAYGRPTGGPMTPIIGIAGAKAPAYVRRATSLRFPAADRSFAQLGEPEAEQLDRFDADREHPRHAVRTWTPDHSRPKCQEMRGRIVRAVLDQPDFPVGDGQRRPG